jgi:hypothetical protein
MVARGSGCPNWSFGIKSEIQASTEDEMALVPMKKPWCNSELPIDKVDEALFATATRVHVHNGQMARFWTSRMVHHRRLCFLVCTSIARERTWWTHKQWKIRIGSETLCMMSWQNQNLRWVVHVVWVSQSSRFQPSWPRSWWDNFDQNLRWEVLDKISLWHAVWR